jgi:hypothetical protein
VGATLITVGVLCLIVNVAWTLTRTRTRDATWVAIAAALTALALTLSLGLLLTRNLHTGLLHDARARTLATHLHVALIGWVFMMIVGVSRKLLPMFLLAHGANTRWTAWSLGLLIPGVIMLGVGLGMGYNVPMWIGAALIEGGVGCFIVQACCAYRARKRPRLDAGLRHVAAALLFLVASALVAPAVLLVGSHHPRLSTLYIVLGLLGGLVLYVVGQFYKIVPFLVWIVRFRSRVGKEAVPTVAALYSARVAHGGLGLFIMGMLGLISGIGTGAVIVTRLGAVIVLCAVLLFASQLTRVAMSSHRSALP